MNVLHAHIPPHTHGDQGKRVTATDRWRTYPRVASASTPPGSCARRSPTTCCALRHPARRPAHPRKRIDATPPDCHRRGPAGPPATPTDPAPTHPLALVQTLAYLVAQHDRIQPASIRASLTHPPKGPTETPTGKAGQTSSYSMPTARQSRSPDPSATRPSPSVDRGLA